MLGSISGFEVGRTSRPRLGKMSKDLGNSVPPLCPLGQMSTGTAYSSSPSLPEGPVPLLFKRTYRPLATTWRPLPLPSVFTLRDISETDPCLPPGTAEQVGRLLPPALPPSALLLCRCLWNTLHEPGQQKPPPPAPQAWQPAAGAEEEPAIH